MLELSDICKIYNKGEESIFAVNHVSFEVRQGDYVSIMGPSGSGKTTLMNIMGCLDVPTAGTYKLCGAPVGRMRGARAAAARNRLIGFVFQSFNLVSGMSALENVELPLILRGESRGKRRERAMDALEQVGLSERVWHRPWELSGGQQQRVAIARVLAADPPLILADEPTGNLDGQSGKEILGIISQMKARGKTIIVITHDPYVASKADRHMIMEKGRMKEVQ